MKPSIPLDGHQYIQDYILAQSLLGFLTQSEEIPADFGLTPEEIRAALDHLQQQGRIFRVSGGWSSIPEVHPISWSQTGLTCAVICPYCGRRHRHGDAPGSRVADCFCGKEYFLVIDGSEQQ